MHAADIGAWQRQGDPYMSLPHPNLFLKPIPFGVDETMLKDHFLPYGLLSSVRICRSPSTVRGLSDDHAFVRFKDIRGAQRALRDPNSCVILGQRMIIKIADADVAPKLKSGLSESEWIYCRGLPPNIPADDVLVMFSQFGRILDMKYFASTASYKGTGVLLRYTCIENAKAAISTMNETSFPGCFQPLLVRFADSPAEKAAKMTRKDLQAKNNARTQPLRDAMVSMAQAMRSQGSGELEYGGIGSLPKGEYPGSPGHRSYVSTGSEILMPEILPGSGTSVSGGSNLSAFDGLRPAQPLQQTRVVSLSGLPHQCDKLWIYENFAVFGAIVGVVMTNKWSSTSNTSSGLSDISHGSVDDNNDTIQASQGSHDSPSFGGFAPKSDNSNNFVGQSDAIVTYVTSQGATKARDAMNGLHIGKSTISVSLEYNAPGPGQLVDMSRALGASLSPRTDHVGYNQQIDLASLQKATKALNLMNDAYSSGFSDQTLVQLAGQLSERHNQRAGGL